MEALTGAGGIAGWIGAGLLGSVLYWLLYKHLPAKDQQIQDMVEAHQRHMQTVIETARGDFSSILMQTRTDFREAVDRILSFNEKQIVHITNIMHRDMEQLTMSVNALNKAVDELTRRAEDRRRFNTHPVNDRRGEGSK